MIGAIHLINCSSGTKLGTYTYLTDKSFYIVAIVKCSFENGTISIGCSINTWGLTIVPVSVAANSIKYR